MGKIESVRDLRVWQSAMNLAMRVFELSKAFPVEERYSPTDQVRRASRSVAANISEAWRKRRYKAAFIAKLNDAEGEADETQTLVEIARRCQYVSQSEAASVYSDYEELLRQLVTMAAHPEQWTIGPPPDR
jgi:four helix bundle protein